MRELVLTPKFRRSFKKFARKNANLKKRIEETLRQMRLDISIQSLGAHKLSGKLEGLQSCSCGYDCRIVFSIEQSQGTQQEVIVLLDIGTHDEVY